VRYRIVYDRGPKSYGAHSPDLPGCIAVGDTLDECRILMREAIRLHLEHSRKYGDPVPTDPTGYVEILDFEPRRPRRARRRDKAALLKGKKKATAKR
jgi:predicted RNase H-like HicB family nuclease